MLMLIAPSKTQESGHSFPAEPTQPLFLEESALLVEELRKLSVPALGKLMKMSERLAVQTHQRIDAFNMPFTAGNSGPALFTFQGDVYSRIDVTGYGQADLDYVQSHLCILSGLYGILRPMDLMQPYRLEMGCRLANSRGKNLYDFWSIKVTEGVNEILATQQEPIVVNLASAEYMRVINKKELKGSLLQVDFKERKGDGYRTVAIHAKRARGMMVDFAVTEKIETVTALKKFQLSGYVFQAELSSEKQYVFTRE